MSFAVPFLLFFAGYDMIPENKHNYVPGSDFDLNLNFKDGGKYLNRTIMMQRCRLPQADGGAWHVQRVVSTFRVILNMNF